MNAKQITPKEIQEYIKSNPTLNSAELSTILNIDLHNFIMQFKSYSISSSFMNSGGSSNSSS